MTSPAVQAPPARRQSLFEITAELVNLDNMLDACGGDVSDPAVEAAITAWYQELLDKEAEKLDAYVGLILDLEMHAAGAKAQAEQWLMRARVNERKAGWLRDRLLNHLVATGKDRIQTAEGRIVKVVNNGGKEPLHVAEGLDLEDVPEEFLRFRRELDRDAVRAALGEGRVLAFANILPRGKRVEFK